MASVLSCDFETRSTVDLKRSGVYVYAESPETEILCMAYAFDDEEPELWTPVSGRTTLYYTPVPDRIREHVEAGRPIRAHNAQFERTIWGHILGPRFGFPVPRLEQWHCTAAEAAAMSLPRALEQCAQVLGLKMQKDVEGYRLMMKMCKPRKPKKGEPKDAVLWHDSPEDRDRLAAYCAQDVRTERAISARVRRLSAKERAVYLLDQKINDRGVLLDVPLVQAAQLVVQEGTARANEELETITEGVADSITKPESIRMWAAAAGVELDNLRKDTVRDLLAEGDLPPDVYRALELRAQTAKTSNAKLQAMLDSLCSDQRARGLLLYHAAATGRWGGKGLQVQNFPRPTVKDVERFITRVMENRFDLIEVEHPALVVVSSMLRSMLIAKPGHEFFSGDYSQIEARVVNWLFGQDDVVEMFAQPKPKVYETTASIIFGIPVDQIGKDSFERQVGKNTELGCGFQMGWKTYQRQAKIQAGLNLPDELCVRAIKAYRDSHLCVKQGWKDINGAAIDAVREPGRVTTKCGRNDCVKFVVRGKWLWCVLPSGRVLAYALPRLEIKEVEYAEVNEETGEEETKTFTTECVTFASVDGMTRQWKRFAGYGGMWTNNVVQATARDLMADAMLRVEAAGFPVVLSCHDELVAEVPKGERSHADYLGLMKMTPEWAAGIPVAAEGWQGQRYRK